MNDSGDKAARAGAPSAKGARAGEPVSVRPPAAGDGYDLLPYPSMPITHTQPAHLAALATLFGIAAPAVERARVLELGCASGGNIMPLAARFPQAGFTGIDLCARHIDAGRKSAAALALRNVTLHQGDLASLTLSGARFDYLICHGVFSWVPQPAQDAILRICHEALAPDGMAVISYNVLPGWHLRMVIRDLCLHYAGDEGTPQRRVARARAALEQIAQSARTGEPYGLLLRTEASRLQRMPAAYILGEFLAPYNSPCTVQDFIGQAARHGLVYLCEADLSASVPQILEPANGSRIAAFAGTDRVGIEQHIDFLTGRPFRCSVLVRQQAANREPRLPSSDRLHSLHLASPGRLDAVQNPGAGGSPEQRPACKADHARSADTTDPIVHQALARLAAAYPATLTLNELAACPECDPKVHAGAAARLSDTLLAMVLAGQASVSALPLQVGLASQVRPRAWFVARQEAASGQPWVTSLRHAAVPAHPLLKALLPYLDGTHDRSALRARLMAALQSGAVRIPELPAGQPPPSHDHFGSVVGHHVERILNHLARHAVLEPDAAAGDRQTTEAMLRSTV